MTILHIGTRTIYDLVRSGRITPADGALLLQLRAEIEYARKPRCSTTATGVSTVRSSFVAHAPSTTSARPISRQSQD
jgi:hypothetical protein